jgi:hypothetical protein
MCGRSNSRDLKGAEKGRCSARDRNGGKEKKRGRKSGGEAPFGVSMSAVWSPGGAGQEGSEKWEHSSPDAQKEKEAASLVEKERKEADETNKKQQSTGVKGKERAYL